MTDLDELQEVSSKEIALFFKGPRAVRESKRAREDVNLAIRTLTAVGRLRGTERVKDATQLAVIQCIANDKDQFRKYVKSSLPHLDPDKKLLARPKK